MEYVKAVFAALSDPLRLRCMALIAREGPLCVCELTHALHVPQPMVSKHMATLRDAGVVVARRQAQWVLYDVATESPPWVHDAVMAAVAAVAESDDHQGDRARLHAMVRPAGLHSA